SYATLVEVFADGLERDRSDHTHAHALPQARIGNPYYGDFGDPRAAIQRPLHVLRNDDRATAVDHLFDASDDPHVLPRPLAEVTAAKPIVLGEGSRRGHLVLEVTEEHQRAARDHFTHPLGQQLAGVG